MKKPEKAFVADLKQSIDDGYMPIKALNQFSHDWRIKARVTKKGDIRTWNNARGTGKLLNIDLVDKDGM